MHKLASGGNGPEMVVVPAGSFGYKHAGVYPAREVAIPLPFALSVYEVTFDDYDRFARQQRVSDEGWGRGRRPAINVAWEDANEYVAWLSAETGADYRLPSEMEWAYAARAGTSTKYSWGDGVGINRANCLGAGPLPVAGPGYEEVGTREARATTDEDFFRTSFLLRDAVVDLDFRRELEKFQRKRLDNAASWQEADWGLMGQVACYDTWWNTAPVGSFAANGFGLYDMHGNVAEWVDGSGAPANCGDSYLDTPAMLGCSSSTRLKELPDVGFRVALTLGP